MGDRELLERYIHLRGISVNFIRGRPASVLELVFKGKRGDKQKSIRFKEDNPAHWNLEMYVRAPTWVTVTILDTLDNIPALALISVVLRGGEFRDDATVIKRDEYNGIIMNFVCGRSKSWADITRVFASQARTDLALEAPIFLKLPQQAGQIPHATIHCINEDILLDIFKCYRLDEENGWNVRYGWCKLSHVCQRWRHLIYDSTFHLGMHIRCTHGTPVVDTLLHLPPIPLLVNYRSAMKEQDEPGIYHALQWHDRIRHVYLHLPPSILQKCLVLMDTYFPRLEDLSLSFKTDKIKALKLPKTFVAPNLRYLALTGIGLPKRLRALTSTVSLVTLVLRHIQASSYFRPRLLVARLSSLPQLEELSIGFSIPIPRPSTERELLGEQGSPVTLHRLKTLRFQGVGAYLESFVAQIKAPHLEQLDIALFNQIIFALPYLSHLINITEAFKLGNANVFFGRDEVTIIMDCDSSRWFNGNLLLRVRCKQLDWQIDCAAQICGTLIPALFGVEQLSLEFYVKMMPTKWENGDIDGATWCDLLRLFIAVKQLYISRGLLMELSRALQVDEVGLDPEFLPDLQHIVAPDNRFPSFFDTRRVAGRPVQFLRPSLMTVFESSSTEASAGAGTAATW